MLTARIETVRAELAVRRPGDWVASILDSSCDGRAVVEYQSADARVIAKFREDGGGIQSYAMLMQLAAAGTHVLRVPTPIAWVDGADALLMSAATGEPCTELTPSRAPQALERIGRALAELHHTPLVHAEPRTMADHIRDLVRPSPYSLIEAMPSWADVIARALEGLLLAERAWGRVAVAPLHRDFHLRQLFDDGRCVTVLDWDDAAPGDPAFDVGYFTTYLRTHRTAEEAECGIRAFRRGYGGDAALWARVPVYERFNYLRRACRRYRLRDAGWEGELEAMLQALTAA